MRGIFKLTATPSKNVGSWRQTTNRSKHRLAGPANLTSLNEFAEPATAVSCIKTPDGQRHQGKRWYYRTDKATGQRCWQLGAQASKLGTPPFLKPVQSVAAKTAAIVLPQAAADAQASLETTYWPEMETAASPGSDIAQAANETRVEPTFDSRWTNLSDLVRSDDRQSVPVKNAEIHRIARPPWKM